MGDWYQRVIVEQAELAEKINKLIDFCNSEPFHKLTRENQFLLNQQLQAMRIYNFTLVRRLEINANQSIKGE